MNQPTRTCAVCINPVAGTVRFEPIGRNDALVAVCSTCATAEVPDPDVRMRVYRVPPLGRPRRVRR